MDIRQEGVNFNDQQHNMSSKVRLNGQRKKQPENFEEIVKKAFIRIVEQPASKALRFRYECEGRLAGSLPGANSTTENKTFPTIEIVGYKGRAVVVASCVTKDAPFKPHPHNLVGKDGCKKGVCTTEVNTETMRAVFSNLGIQCVKRKDINQSLKLREEIRVDPFRTGFGHKFNPSSIDLNAVRLCFQAFLENEYGRFTIPLTPVVSEPIYDKKAMVDLLICALCSCTSTVAGGKDIILLCEKVVKDDILIRFYEEKDGHVIWEAYGDFQPSDIHKQTAIRFKTPTYKTLDVNAPVKVYVQLKRPSDGGVSEPVPFEYLPLDSDPITLKRKRLQTGGDPNIYLLRHLQNQGREQYDKNQNSPIENGAVQQPASYANTLQTGPSKHSTCVNPVDYSTYVENGNPHYNNHPRQEFIHFNGVQKAHTDSNSMKPATMNNNININNFNHPYYQGQSWPTSCRQQQQTNNLNNPCYTGHQTQNYCNMGFKEETPNSLLEMDSDLLMNFNSAELERLTLT